jgi:hypothetical protein
VSAPDIRPGDFIRVFAGAGVRRCGFELQRTLRLEVIAVGEPPGRPDWRYVSGRICRADLTHGNQIQHTSLEITGPERSILDLTGQWQLLRRSPSSERS